LHPLFHLINDFLSKKTPKNMHLIFLFFISGLTSAQPGITNTVKCQIQAEKKNKKYQ